uniref:Acyl-CoA dehydrogenase family protein n=1 Tax=Haliea sp. ETY-M TaxID=1055105 RepID=A0A455R3L1_9GAMM|nr:acyl-CoA dehydrogenase family protein [Haliea sp. ETY-M]
MALVLNEEQVMLRDSAAGFLGGKASVAQLRALRDGDEELRFDAQVWSEMVEMGWAAIAIPEGYGGLGYGYTGLGVVLEQMGRHLSAAPLQSAVLLGATLLEALGSEAQKSEWLAAIAAGERRVSLALQEGAQFAPRRVALRAEPDGDGFVLNGEKSLVADALGADAFVVIGRSGDAAGADGISAFLVPADAAGLTVTPCDLVDARQYGALQLQDVRVDGAQLLGAVGKAWPALERALDIGAVGIAAELLGLSLEAFERTMDYIRERKQFGVPIGSFQGLQHRAATLFTELELARSIVLKALHAVDEGSEELPLLASAAKAKLSAVAVLATNEGVQMHGGVGMTDEYDIGLYMKRARVLRHMLGDENYHLDRFARLEGF